MPILSLALSLVDDHNLNWCFCSRFRLSRSRAGALPGSEAASICTPASRQGPGRWHCRHHRSHPGPVLARALAGIRVLTRTQIPTWFSALTEPHGIVMMRTEQARVTPPRHGSSSESCCSSHGPSHAVTRDVASPGQGLRAAWAWVTDTSRRCPWTRTASESSDESRASITANERLWIEENLKLRLPPWQRRLPASHAGTVTWQFRPGQPAKSGGALNCPASVCSLGRMSKLRPAQSPWVDIPHRAAVSSACRAVGQRATGANYTTGATFVIVSRILAASAIRAASLAWLTSNHTVHNNPPPPPALSAVM